MALEEVVKWRAGKYLPRGQYVDNGEFFVYGSNSVMGRYDQALVHVPHVVMAAIGANAGAVRHSAAPAWINNNAFGLVPTDALDSQFLALWLELGLDRARVLAGTGQPYVKRSNLLAERMPLPPLDVQREVGQLATQFGACQAALAEQGRSLTLLVRAFNSSVQGSHRDGRPVIELGSIADIQQGRRVEHAQPGLLPAPMYGANGVIGSWHHGTYDFPVIALGCRGSVGTVTVAKEGSWLGNNVMAVWPKDASMVDFSFLRWWLSTTDLRASGAITGQVQLQITRAALSPILVRLPSIEEQAILGATLNLIAGLQDALRVEASSLMRARRAVLTELVNGGDVAVKQ